MRALHAAYVLGNRNCHNDCYGCVAEMTPNLGIGSERIEVTENQVKDATHKVVNAKVENIMFTSKGATDLYPGQVSQYLAWISHVTNQRNYHFNRIELQTDGGLLAKSSYNDWLDAWKAQSLDTVALSLYHIDPVINKREFRPKSGKYFDLPKLIDKLHTRDYKVRLNFLLYKDCVDSPEQVKKLIEFGKDHKIFQMSLRTPWMPKEVLDTKRAKEAQEYINKHRLSGTQLEDIVNFVTTQGEFCYSLPYGAEIYDLDGQNIGLTTGGTKPSKGKDQVRELIVLPQGDELWVTTSWQNPAGGRIW